MIGQSKPTKKTLEWVVGDNMSWKDIVKKSEIDNITKLIEASPRYVKTAWGEVMRWLGEQE